MDMNEPVEIQTTTNPAEAEILKNVLEGEGIKCDVHRKKPHPDLFPTAAQRPGLPPADCLVVEDTVAGVEAAKAAGCRCLALTTSFPAERLTAADQIAPALAQIPPVVWQ